MWSEKVMKHIFRNALIGGAAVAAAAIALILAFHFLRHSLIQENEALAHSVAQSILPALLVNDTEQVASVMKSLETYPGIQTAELISSEGARWLALHAMAMGLIPLDKALSWPQRQTIHKSCMSWHRSRLIV
jgi:cell division protein FtsX